MPAMSSCRLPRSFTCSPHECGTGHLLLSRPCSGFATEPARDVMLGLLKTCRKLGLSFFTYLGDRLSLNTDQPKIPPLANLVIRAA